MSNKSGTSEQVIKLPKGGGELQGLGESFSPDLHTGTGNYSVPISLPPGRNGFQPELGLVYSTGNGNSCFGLGWQLSIPGVSRKTAKGIPRYFDGNPDNQQDTFLLSGAEDLIPVAKDEEGIWTQYRPRTEGLFAIIKRYKDPNNDYWKVKSKDGLTSFYNQPGLLAEPSSTVFDPVSPNDIFDWKLMETRDPFGNKISYQYLRDQQETESRHWNQLYLEKIKYLDFTDENGDEHFLVSVTFEYEEGRPDPFSVYTSGFEIRTEKRCKRINIQTHPNPGESILVRTYDFEYKQAPYSKISLLKKVQVTGHQNGETEQLPPLEFSYTPFETDNNQFRPVSGPEFPKQSLGNADTEIIDLFGNGLPDIIQINGQVRFWKNLGNGLFDSPRHMKESPAGLQLGQPGVQFTDVTGDGKADLVVQNETFSGFFPSRFDGQFDKRSFQKLEVAPTFNLQDTEVKLVDLNGDGVTDALRSGSRMECFFNDPQKGWSELIVKERKALEEFPNVSMSDPRIRLADMTGDNLQDIVFIHQGIVEYWPNLGYGNWGKRIRMRNAPRLPAHYDPKRLLVGDIAGDGPHDIIYIGNRKIDVWINQSGNGFSEKITIEGTPPVTDMDSVRLIDLYGTGISGILWSSDERTPGRPHYFFLDFTNGIKPLVLREMNNNMGAITKVKYLPSTHYYLQDEQQKATRWKTPLPFPVQVVACVEVIDEISKNKLVTEYNYHHGYWDGAEREYRGFGRVEQINTQTFQVYKENGLHGDHRDFQKVEEKFYTPPTKTITWFHQGPVGEGIGDWSVCNFSDEYWQVDKNQLAPFSGLADFLKNLPRRRERRDALRTLRGRVLRTELYALDGESDAPYTVSESVFSIRKEGESLTPLKRMSGTIFMPMAIAQRSTQWERGDDPMTKFSFTKDFDAYGQARQQIAIACPRGWKKLEDNIAENTPFLATFGKTVFIDEPSEESYIKDRTCKSTSFEILHYGNQKLEDILAAIEDPDRLELIAQAISYYDGTAFMGLPFGKIGKFGVPVRSENLIITENILTDFWKKPDGTDSDLPPYLMPNTNEWPDEYPTAFKNRMPELAGYLFHDGTDEHTRGYWATTSSQFDFQEENTVWKKGLPIAQKDALGRVATIEYDSYHFLPVKSTNPIGLSIEAKNDYRLFQPFWSMDPNGNTSFVTFSPLGFVTETYVLGKENVEEGDGLNDQDSNAIPGSVNEYDWLAWMGNRQPVHVKSTVREHHLYDTYIPAGEKDHTITSIEFSDGFGRIIQTRTQAEEVLFGDELLGNEVLPENQSDDSVLGSFAGKISSGNEANVVVSGWQIYDNKGQVVQKYEPFYSHGFAYADLSDNLIGKKVEQFYDPLGRVIKTGNPDGSVQQVVFGIPENLDSPENYTPTPWEAYSYDENDNAERSNQATLVPSTHWNTPSSIEVDALGRTIRTVARNGQSDTDQIVTHSTYDIRGNLLTVTDALGRMAFRHFYDLTFDEENGSQVWRTENIDAGMQKSIFNVLGLPIESHDSKGCIALNEYDLLSRPTHLWARDNATLPLTLRQQLVYADEGFASMSPARIEALQKQNRLGTLYRHYDEAGRLAATMFDFKGNLLLSERHAIKTEHLLALAGNTTFQHFQIDWQTANVNELLEEHGHVISTTYDALNRPKRIHYPKDVHGGRKIVMPSYNRAGALESIKLYNAGLDTNKVGVQHIAYNAKGQRTLIAYRNGLMTRYAYDDDRFWLKRLRTEKFAYNENRPFAFTPDGGVLQDIGYEYDLVGNITCLKERGQNLGIPGTALGKDALNRDFTYDPIYRLLSATGREHEQRMPLGNEPWKQEINPTHPGSVTNPNTRFYTRNYEYDKVGNITKLIHSVPSNSSAGFTRNFDLKGGNTQPLNNQLEKYTQGGPNHQLMYDLNGNLIREATSRHYHWNHADQLHAFRIQANEDATPSLEARYLYDAGGERVKKIVWHQGGKVTTTTYIGGLFEYHTEETAGEFKENNTLHLLDDKSRIVLFRVGAAFAPQDNLPEIQYQLSDHLGNVQVVATSSGGAHSREEHYPYGGTSLGSYTQKRYRFTGKERDEESGLNYHSARYYAPWMFKWISADPAGMVDGVNLYGYCGGNPIRNTDLNGRETKIQQEKRAKKVESLRLKKDAISSISEYVFFLPKGITEIGLESAHRQLVASLRYDPSRQISYARNVKKWTAAKISVLTLSSGASILGAFFDYKSRRHQGKNIVQAATETGASTIGSGLFASKYYKGSGMLKEAMLIGINYTAKKLNVPTEFSDLTSVAVSNTPVGIVGESSGLLIESWFALMSGKYEGLNRNAASSSVGPIAAIGQVSYLVRGKKGILADDAAEKGRRGIFPKYGVKVGKIFRPMNKDFYADQLFAKIFGRNSKEYFNAVTRYEGRSL